MHIEEIDGQSFVAKVYQHQGPHFFEQTNYFRLMSVDFNGFRSFSEAIVVESRTKPTKVYPNPFHGTLQIPCSEIACAVFLFDLQGRRLAQLRGPELDLSHLKSGVYFLKLGNRIERIVKQ